MTDVPTLLTDLVRQALARLLEGEVPAFEPVVATQDERHGDYQSNAAFRLGRRFRAAPRQVAERIAAALPDHPAVARVEVAGPGFLNFTLSDDWLAGHLAALADDPHLGIRQREGTVVIDYSSPNVAKRMHVGHLRSTVIGNALDRMHRAAGYRVIADNHIGDWGTQFGKLIVAWRRWADPEVFERDPIAELQRLYVRFGIEAETERSLEDEARAATAALQAGDPECRALWKRFLEASLQEFEAIYRRLGVSFDVTLGESHYHDMLAGLVEDLLARGIAEESQGAVIIRFGPEDGKGLEDSPMLIRKADGAFLYATTDLATVRYRLDRWHPDRILYVTDSRQQLHFRQLFAACRKLGWDEAELIHVWFGTLVTPTGAMSTRQGNVINLRDLLDEAVRRARALVDEKSPHLPDEERAEVAEALGIGAVRYADLSQNPQSKVVFEWDRMLAMDGNTAPYLVYSHARCRSLQRKGGVERPTVEGLAIGHPLERQLALHLVRYPEVFEAALASQRPNLVAEHLFGLANRFNRFYYELPVLKAEEPVRTARLALVEASRRVLSAGLDLLGIRALDRM